VQALALLSTDSALLAVDSTDPVHRDYAIAGFNQSIRSLHWQPAKPDRFDPYQLGHCGADANSEE